MVSYQDNGYVLKSAEVNYVVYWQKEDSNYEVKIILPVLKLEKKEITMLAE